MSDPNLLLRVTGEVLSDPATWLIVLQEVLAVYAISAVHEGVHWLAARSVGVRGRFTVAWWLRLPVGLAVDLPDGDFAALTPLRRFWALMAPALLLLAWPLASAAGFGLELLLVVIGGSLLPYAVTTDLASDGMRALDALLDASTLTHAAQRVLLFGGSPLVMALLTAWGWATRQWALCFVSALLTATTLGSLRGLARKGTPPAKPVGPEPATHRLSHVRLPRDRPAEASGDAILSGGEAPAGAVIRKGH